MPLIRWYFLRNLGHIVTAELSRSHTPSMTHESSSSAGDTRDTRAHLVHEANDWSLTRRTKRSGQQRRSAPIHPDMVRRLDVAPHRISPMGSHAPTIPLIVIEESGLDTIRHTASHRSLHSSMAPSHPPLTEEDDLGEFPGLQRIINCALQKVYPRFQRTLARTLTIPPIETLVPCEATMLVPPAGSVKLVPYLSFTATVRHSMFQGLTQANIEELGGVEYRALTALMWIIPLVGAVRVTPSTDADPASVLRGIPRYLLRCHGAIYGHAKVAGELPPTVTASEDKQRMVSNLRASLGQLFLTHFRFTAFQIVGAWANTGT